LSAPRASPTTSPAWFSALSDLLVSSLLLASLFLPHNHSVNPRELANSVCDKLQRQGHQAFLVGGCVRDLLLGREPADYDVSTSATPSEVLGVFPKGLDVGAHFGVILLHEDSQKVEIATFRSDVGYSDGRHPDRVVYSKTPEDAVHRRDFTINRWLRIH